MRKGLLSVLAVGSTLALAGCGLFGGKEPKETVKPTEKVKTVDYFAHLPINSWNGAISMVSGDFNRDENLDLIVGIANDNNTQDVKLYLFEGDGKGNFTKKTYTR